MGLVQRVGQLAPDLDRCLREDLRLALLELLQDGPQGRAMDVLHDHRGLLRQVLEDPDDAAVLDLVEEVELLEERVGA